MPLPGVPQAGAHGEYRSMTGSALNVPIDQPAIIERKERRSTWALA
jgi:hypothetical protein